MTKDDSLKLHVGDIVRTSVGNKYVVCFVDKTDIRFVLALNERGFQKYLFAEDIVEVVGQTGLLGVIFNKLKE